MKNIFKPLSGKELAWPDNFLMERIDEDADTRYKDEGVYDLMIYPQKQNSARASINKKAAYR